MNIFSNRLIQWRIENFYTQEDVAYMCNVSVRSIQSWEEGARLPNFDSHILLADVMGVSIDWLCGRTEYWETADVIIQKNYSG